MVDVDVLRNLEASIGTFPGVAIIISHDRYFLDRISSHSQTSFSSLLFIKNKVDLYQLATHIIAFEGDSNVVFFEGNYSEYEEDRLKRLGSKFDPKRIKYRKLEKI